jgi:hypothetical protein
MRYDRALFKPYYIARWAAWVPFHPVSGQADDWYERLGVEHESGYTLVDIFPLREAQAAELQRVWELPSP